MPKEGILQFATANGLTPENIDFTHVAALTARYELSYEATVIALDQAGLISPEKKAELTASSKKAGDASVTSLDLLHQTFAWTTLREWGLHKTMRALELGVISTRRAVALAKQMGYDEEVVRQNLSLLDSEGKE